jgi:hypothetical protein
MTSFVVMNFMAYRDVNNRLGFAVYRVTFLVNFNDLLSGVKFER